MASTKAIAADLARRESHRTMFQRRPYTVDCPRCQAQPGRSCRRPDGEERPAHSERVLNDLLVNPPDPQRRLWEDDSDI